MHELEAGAYNLLGIVSVNQGNAHFALDYLYQADKMLYKVKKKTRNAIALCENHGENTGTQ